MRAEARFYQEFTRPGVTTALISHRLAILRHADHIVVLSSEQGSHGELTRADGEYAAVPVPGVPFPPGAPLVGSAGSTLMSGGVYGASTDLLRMCWRHSCARTLTALGLRGLFDAA